MAENARVILGSKNTTLLFGVISTHPSSFPANRLLVHGEQASPPDFPVGELNSIHLEQPSLSLSLAISAFAGSWTVQDTSTL
jgi:hypothetical protein